MVDGVDVGTDVRGTVADGYEPVRDAFLRNFAERGDLGAAVTVYRDGRKVVDLWGGTTGEPAARAVPAAAAPAEPAGPAVPAEPAGPAVPAVTAEPATCAGTDGAWQADTAVILRSASKGPAASVPHLLHQRGQLDLDAPVGTYWPEFKANGKERVLVRHLLSHRAGLPALDTPLTPEQAIDGVSGARALAAQAPLWTPGTDHGYHPQTYGWLLGELVLRVTGRSLGQWFAEEIAGPLGLDLWFGLPADRAADVARTESVQAPPLPAARGLRVRPKRAVTEAYRDPASLTRRAFAAIDPEPDENAPAYRAAELPASAGIATARSLARFYAALVGPPVDGPGGGRRLFTPATLTQARSEESAGPDRTLVVPTRFGLGFMLHGPSSPMLGAGSFGHPGRGGSLAFADPESGTAFAYVTRAMQKSVTSDPRAQALVRALRFCG